MKFAYVVMLLAWRVVKETYAAILGYFPLFHARTVKNLENTPVKWKKATTS